MTSAALLVLALAAPPPPEVVTIGPGTPPAELLELLADERLVRLRAVWTPEPQWERTGCHAGAQTLAADLIENGIGAHFFIVSAMTTPIPTPERPTWFRLPRGPHTWIEHRSGWVIDVTSRAGRPIVIAPAAWYRRLIHASRIRETAVEAYRRGAPHEFVRGSPLRWAWTGGAP